MKEIIIQRFREPSTWRGIMMLAIAGGVTISPEMQNNIIAIGVGLSGLIGVFTGENR